MRPSDITDGVRRVVVVRLPLPRASMRPSDITDGVPREALHRVPALIARFNEAVGYYRRKSVLRSIQAEGNCFNEAVGYYRRSLGLGASASPSVLPTESSAGGFNEAVGYYRRSPLTALAARRSPLLASMRPSGITDGKLAHPSSAPSSERASMRPSGITDGIAQNEGVATGAHLRASMRPSGITDGILDDAVGTRWAALRFNEAVGYYRRNRARRGSDRTRRVASMKPSGITDGIIRGEHSRDIEDLLQ